MLADRNEIEILINNKLQNAEKTYGIAFKLALIEILSLEKLLQPQTSEEKPKKLIPLPQWNKYHNYPSVSALRMKVFYQETNGFKDFNVVHKKGKRVFIDENAYFRWQESKEPQSDQSA